MTSCLQILVLVANEKDATLSTNTDGVTRLLRKMEWVSPVNDGGDLDPNARHTFACELMMALCRGTGEHDYDGVVIFAEASMMEELRQVQTSAISRLMIAHVVGKPFEADGFPSINVADAKPDYRGAVH